MLYNFTHCDDLFLVVSLLLHLHAFYVQVDPVISQNGSIKYSVRYRGKTQRQIQTSGKHKMITFKAHRETEKHRDRGADREKEHSTERDRLRQRERKPQQVMYFRGVATAPLCPICREDSS